MAARESQEQGAVRPNFFSDTKSILLAFIVPACQLQIALKCSIHSQETTFKELGLLIV
jgi:hypothetical protein